MFRRTIYFISIFFFFIGGSMLLPLFVALLYGEARAARAFVLAILIALALGAALLRLRRTGLQGRATLRVRDSYFVVSCIWILASMLGALPFLFEGSISSPVDAFFEMCSGFSTTGATILADVEVLPRSLLFWRAETQWLGGMGIIVLVVALLPSLGIGARNMASAETPGPIVAKMTSRFSDTARRLYLVYLTLTVLLILLLLLGGMTLYEAVTYAFTTAGTGGFSIYNNNIAHFHSPYILWVLAIFMFLGGTNFTLFFVAIQEKVSHVFRDEEFRVYLGIIGIGTLLVALGLFVQGGEQPWIRALSEAAFQVTAIVSTTGFTLSDFDLWPDVCKMLLLLLMFSGGMSSSTAGGIKVVRILIAFKMLRRDFRLRIHDNLVDNVKYNGRKVPSRVMTHILTLMSTYILTLLAGTLLISCRSGADLITDFTAVLACMSNVGTGLAGVGSTCNFAFYSDYATFLLSLIMMLGRLELNTLLVLFSYHYWNTSRA